MQIPDLLLWDVLLSPFTLQEHNLLETGSGREEVQEHDQTDRLTYIDLISSLLHLYLLDRDEIFCVTWIGNLGLFREN